MKVFRTQSNGGERYKIVCESGHLSVFRAKENDGKYGDKAILESGYTSLIPSKDNSGVLWGPKAEVHQDGQALLARVADSEYLYFDNENIYRWTVDESEIAEFYSPTGNSDVQYPYVIGRNRVYLMYPRVSIPLIKKWEKWFPYGFYYHLLDKTPGVKKIPALKKISTL